MKLPGIAKSAAVNVLMATSSTYRKEGVCILHVGRVGSTVLADMLGRTDGVASYGEIYHREWERILHATYFEGYHRPRDPYYLLKRCLSKSGRDIPVFEMKFLETQHLRMLAPTLEAFVRDMDGFGIGKYIVLERRNILRRAVSVQALIDTNVTHVQGGDKAAGRRKRRIDVSAVPLDGEHLPLVRYIDKVQAGYAEVRKLVSAYPNLDITYEDDIASDPRVGYRKCCDFLGLTPIQIEPRYRRTNPDPVRDSIANYPEVEAALKGTRHEWMLEA